jgi:hypothetical protein
MAGGQKDTPGYFLIFPESPSMTISNYITCRAAEAIGFFMFLKNSQNPLSATEFLP